MDRIILASLQDVKTFLEIENSVRTFDDMLYLLLAGVSNKIESYLNRFLLKKERVEGFDAEKRKIFLRAYPVDLTSRIEVVDLSDNSLLGLNNDYYIWPEIGMVEFYSIIPRSIPRQIRITYTGGFPYIETVSIRNRDYYLLDVPDTIALATVKQVSYEFLRRKELGISSFSSPEGSLSVQNYDLLPEVRQSLLLYRRMPNA